MKYSVLYFSHTNLHPYFEKDENCVQIVMSSEDIVSLAKNPHKKVQLVSQTGKIYYDLFNALKAVSQENVILVEADDISENEIQKVITKLSEYPAVSYEEKIQGFDTRLLMFCLQYAIELNLEIDSYIQTVSMFAKTPIAHV